MNDKVQHFLLLLSFTSCMLEDSRTGGETRTLTCRGQPSVTVSDAYQISAKVSELRCGEPSKQRSPLPSIVAL